MSREYVASRVRTSERSALSGGVSAVATRHDIPFQESARFQGAASESAQLSLGARIVEPLAALPYRRVDQRKDLPEGRLCLALYLPYPRLGLIT